MTKSNRDLFKPVVSPTKLDPQFAELMQNLRFEAARVIMNEEFANFHDIDHSFVREFQTGGFSARVFELALFAYTREKGLTLDRTHASPDFLLDGDPRCAIEVTTTNPTQDATRKELTQLPDNLEAAALAFVFQIGKALRRKINHRVHGLPYWELPHVVGAPFVIAVGAFHDQHAQLHPMGLVAEYLYGTRDIASYDKTGKLTLRHETVTKHNFEEKEIPSGLFRQIDGRNLAGVLFSNNHTAMMFNRIGGERGLAAPNTAQLRFGSRYASDPDASEPAFFAYVISNTATEERESFSEGLHLFLNPWAHIPLNPRALPGVTVHELQDNGDLLTTTPPGLHPYMSKTISIVGPGADEFAHYKCLEILGLLPPDRGRHSQ
ncbi:hypothetical protein ACFWAD_11860 [Rhodococcus sp. NPDC059969]|uniref:hypothetical protein n=1 Tax=Rhodococcus sp. NPDC059969 TaxID=3347018 RepID=UPI0036709A00